jgi:hypothetical protein
MDPTASARKQDKPSERPTGGALGRELVAAPAASGRTYRQLCAARAGRIALGTVSHTTRDYLKSVHYKLDCVSSAQAVTKALSIIASDTVRFRGRRSARLNFNPFPQFVSNQDWPQCASAFP